MDPEETTVVTDQTEVSTSPETTPPASPPSPEEEAAQLREDNARLRGENAALREPRPEPRREPEPAREPTSVDPHAAEFKNIENAFARGEITDAERVVRLGALGAEAAIARRETQDREQAAKTRNATARRRSGQKIAAYIARFPGLNTQGGAEMQRVGPHLRAVTEEFGLEETDERAQVLALERTFGPIDRSPTVDHREYERRRYPIGGGGGMEGEEPQSPEKPKSHGERIFAKLLPEYQQFYIQTRGSKEAAIRTLQHADEHQMRKQGRFA